MIKIDEIANLHFTILIINLDFIKIVTGDVTYYVPISDWSELTIELEILWLIPETRKNFKNSTCSS